MKRATVLLAAATIVVPLSGCLDPYNYGQYGSYGGQSSVQRRTCSGCGGTGRSSSYLARSGFDPNTPGFRSGPCPSCGGSGYSRW
jgi:hypothetical protein